MNGATTPSEEATSQLEEFLRLRDSLRSGPIGAGGSEVCRHLTESLDDAVRSLGSGLPETGFAVVAVGGYGREELSPYSDVDLMLLHDGADPAAMAASLFRPLWDAGLRLGHAVRTVPDASRVARERFDTFTTLLTSRLVAGDEELFARLTAGITPVIKARPLRQYLVSEERERRRQSPYLLMATDVKAGRGGLRTLQGFEWERRREALIGRFSAEIAPDEEEAHETLLTLRNALHATAGRALDTYAFDLRAPVARWLGIDPYDASQRLVDAIHTVDRLATARWPEIVEGDESLTRRIWNRLRGPTDRDVATEPPSAADFASILRSGEQGRLTMERLRSSGHLAAIVPEWEVVRSAPHLAPFHEHPVDAHLWRTVDEMQGLIESDGEYGEVAREVGDPDALTLAAFLHDIGKAHGGDHAVVGARIARSVCERLGCSDDVTRLVEGAVRHHLLLSETATRRDLDDPGVVDEVVETVGDPRLLHILYLLTVADSKATGATMWTGWKATLVRTLYHRCLDSLDAGRSGGRSAIEMREQLLAAVDSADRDRVAAHLDAMPPDYIRSTSGSDLRRHLELIEHREDDVAIGVVSGSAADAVVVVGRARPDLRRRVAESLAANGVDVLEARLSTRTDGLVVDTFHVRDDRTGGPIPTDRWERTEADIRASLTDQVDTASKVVRRARTYSGVVGADVPTEATVSVDADAEEGVVTITCPDRIGRLAEILGLFGELGLDVRLAKLDSRHGVVVDTFHVVGPAVPADEDGAERLRARIGTAVGG